MKAVSTSEARNIFSELLAAVESGEEIVITSHRRPVAKLVAFAKPTSRFLDRSVLRDEVPPMVDSAERTVEELRDTERY